MLRDYIVNVLIFITVFVSLSPKLCAAEAWLNALFYIYILFPNACSVFVLTTTTRILIEPLVAVYWLQFIIIFLVIYIDMILNSLTQAFELKLILIMVPDYLLEIIIFYLFR